MTSLRSVAVPFAVVVLALFGMSPSVAAANPCFLPGNCSGDTQVLAVSGSGGLFHANRYPEGTWTPMGNVKQMTGDPGPVTRVGLSG